MRGRFLIANRREIIESGAAATPCKLGSATWRSRRTRRGIENRDGAVVVTQIPYKIFAGPSGETGAIRCTTDESLPDGHGLSAAR